MHDYYVRRFLEDCLTTAAWAGGAALAIQLLGAIGSTAPARAASVALVVGLFTALFTAGGIPPLPVSDRWQWIPWLTAAALLLLFVEDGPSAGVARGLLIIAFAAAIEWAILRPTGRLVDSGAPARTALLAGVGVALLAVLWTGELRAAVAPMWRTFGLHALTAAGAAVAYATVSQVSGQVVGGFAAALGAVALFGLAKSSGPAGRTGVTVASVLYCGILLARGLSADFPIASSLLLLVAWMAPSLPNRGTGRDHAIQLAVAIVPAGLAFLIAKG